VSSDDKTVKCVAHGQAALDFMAETPVHIVISDWYMEPIDGYLLKPFTPQQLEAKMREALKRRGTA
jgi:DNA-binding response OmpR family regulator